MSRRPDFVIIGAQKAGSSLLHHSLRAHPQVWLSPAEDPFFRDPVFQEADLDHHFGVAYGGRSEARIGMKCPDYLACQEVPERLHRLLDVPDLLLTLRNPVDRALSAYFWWMRWGLIPVLPAEEGLRAILDARLATPGQLSDEILDWGRYGEHVARYLSIFPREKLHVIVDDDFRRDPASAVRSTFAFLGVRQDVPLPPSTDDNPGIYSLDRLRFLQRRNRYILQWDESSTFASIPKPRRPLHRLVSNVVAGTDRYLLSRVYGNAKPRLSARLRADMHAFYRDDIDRLADLLGISVASWAPSASAGSAVPRAD